MPDKWPDQIYDYDKKAIAHPDIDDLDLADGRWWKCKFCKNTKD